MQGRLLPLLAALLGACGRVDFEPVPVPLPGIEDAATPPLTEVAQVMVGGRRACARLVSGDLWCWGDNTRGLLGTGETTGATPLPVRTLVRGARDVDLNDDNSLSLRAGGGVDAWGFNTYGALGDGTFDAHTVPQDLPGASDAIAVAAAQYASCVLRADRTVACAGIASLRGDGATVDRSSLDVVPGLTDVVMLGAGEFHMCAILAADRAMKCWGDNGEGQLGDGTLDARATPTAVVAGAYASVTGGDLFTCAVRVDGGVDCWGKNASGQLGDGTRDGRAIPGPVPGVTDTIAIAAGSDHACALAADGVVRCWGANKLGEVGNGEMDDALTPVVIDVPAAIGISSHTGLSTCVLTAAPREVWCWGENAYGQLGLGTTSELVRRPARVVGLP